MNQPYEYNFLIHTYHSLLLHDMNSYKYLQRRMSRSKKPGLAFSGTIEAGKKKKKLSQHAKACRDRVGEPSTTESKPLPTLDSERVSGAQ
jgi:hypothetical protein